MNHPTIVAALSIDYGTLLDSDLSGEFIEIFSNTIDREDRVLIVATVNGHTDWAAYCGVAESGEEHVARQGTKLFHTIAKALFPLLAVRYTYRR